MSADLVFGLDLGLNNVGWAAIRRQEDAVDILAMGTYVFPSPLVDDKDASSGLSSRDRGMKRRARRTILRRAQRTHRLYALLNELGMLPTGFQERSTFLCQNKRDGKAVDPYSLRDKGVRAKLEPLELGRVLCHLNQRRGFLSPRDLLLVGVARTTETDATDEETRGMLGEIRQTRALLAGRSLGQFLAERIRDGQPVRKKKVKGGTPAQQSAEDRRRFVRSDRWMIEDELDRILSAQRQYHPLLTDSVCKRIRELVTYQRPMGANEGSRGKCSFFPQENRMPRATLLAQKFVIAQDVANLKLVDGSTGEIRRLSPDERKTLVAALMDCEGLTWEAARRAIKANDWLRFDVEPTGKQRVGRKGLKGSKTVSEMKSALGEIWDRLSHDKRHDLVNQIVSIRDWAKKIKEGQRGAAHRRFELFRSGCGKLGIELSEQQAADLATVELPKGYLNISRKAARLILPDLLKDAVYSEACERHGLNHAQPSEAGPLDRLPYPTSDQIRHPLVLCSVRNAVRVLNCLVEEYGKPDAIHIELPRDLARSAEDREKVEEMQRDRESERNGIRKELLTEGYPANETNIKKVRLWRECGCMLPYEPEIQIASVKDLIEADLQIDHIVPRSYSYDNSWRNLALCTADFNIHRKGDKTPFEVFADDPKRWGEIKRHVNNMKGLSPGKRALILAEERPEGGFQGRHLAATGYISREVLALAQRLTARPVDTFVTNGSATGELRRQWGLDRLIPLHPEEEEAVALRRRAADPTEDWQNLKPAPPKARSNYKHHALDALVIALCDRHSFKRITDFYKLKERTGRAPEGFILHPDPKIVSKTVAAFERCVIVHRPDRKVRGELHKQMPKSDGLANLPPGVPWSSKVVGKHLVRFGATGQPEQAYPLGNNHHVVIWERATPNAKGIYERCAEVVPTIEAARRKAAKEPIIRRTRPEPGWRFVMSLCKGDTVEMADGTYAQVSKFSPEARECNAEIGLWQLHAAEQLGAANAENPYLVRRVRTAAALPQIRAREIQNPIGQARFREGVDD